MMDELVAWLKHQNGGLRTYIDFQQRTARLASEQTEHAALFSLLSSLSGRFATSYDGMPLPVEVANKALSRLTTLAETAVTTMKRGPEERLRLLNEIAQADLG
jgi:hypothetical protein